MISAVEQIKQEWRKESVSANQCIVEILDSYMEMISIIRRALDVMVKMDDKKRRELVHGMATLALVSAEASWKDIHQRAKELLQKENANEE